MGEVLYLGYVRLTVLLSCGLVDEWKDEQRRRLGVAIYLLATYFYLPAMHRSKRPCDTL